MIIKREIQIISQCIGLCCGTWYMLYVFYSFKTMELNRITKHKLFLVYLHLIPIRLLPLLHCYCSLLVGMSRDTGSFYSHGLTPLSGLNSIKVRECLYVTLTTSSFGAPRKWIWKTNICRMPAILVNICVTGSRYYTVNKYVSLVRYCSMICIKMSHR